MKSRSYEARLLLRTCLFLNALLTLVVVAETAMGQTAPDSSCPELLSRRLPPGKMLQLQMSDSNWVSGRLLSFDSLYTSVRIFRFGETRLLRDTIAYSDILSLKYKRRWHFKTHYIVYIAAGFLVGGYLGQAIESVIDPSYRIGFYPFDSQIDYEDGAAIGAIVGAVAGLVIPMAIGSRERIDCR